MLLGAAQYNSCVWIQADIDYPRQESLIKIVCNAYEDPETGKLYPKLIVNDFTYI